MGGVGGSGDAAELFAQGRTQAEVARDLGVSRQAVSVWHARFTEGGVDALRSRGPTGPDPKLSAVQLAKVEQACCRAPRRTGSTSTCGPWSGSRWSSPSSPESAITGHVWSILRRRLDWSLQRPERGSIERDEQTIAR